MIIKRSHFVLALGIATLLLLSQQASAGGQELRRSATSTTVAAQVEPGGRLTFSRATQTINRRDTVSRVRSSASIEHSLTVTTTFTVTVGPNNSFTFAPATQTIDQGDTVNWVWDSTLIHHSTTSGSCSGLTCTSDSKWDSSLQVAPFNFPVTFNTFGTFPYFCTLHGTSGMVGTIVVVAPFNLFLPLILK